MSTRKTTLFYGVLIAIASLAVGMVIASQWGLPQASSAQTVNVPAANSAALNGPIDAQTFRNIAKSQSPTVVNIQTMTRVSGRELTEFFGGNDDLLQRFFGGQQPAARPAGAGDRRREEGTGTGFIIDKGGFIITNNHVVEGAEDIRISLFSGGRNRELPGQGRRPRRLDRYGPDSNDRDAVRSSPGSQVRGLIADAAWRLGCRDWQPVQAGPHGHGRRRLGARPAAGRHDRTAGQHAADGRGHQPREFRRSAAERPWRGRGYQHRDLHRQAERREHRHRLRDADQRRSRSPAAASHRQSRARRDRRLVSADPITKEVAQGLGLPGAGRRAVVPRSSLAIRPTRRACSPETSSSNSTAGRSPTTRRWSIIVVATKPGTTVPLTVYRQKQRRTFNITIAELDLEAEQGIAGPPRPA